MLKKTFEYAPIIKGNTLKQEAFAWGLRETISIEHFDEMKEYYDGNTFSIMRGKHTNTTKLQDLCFYESDAGNIISLAAEMKVFRVNPVKMGYKDYNSFYMDYEESISAPLITSYSIDEPPVNKHEVAAVDICNAFASGEYYRRNDIDHQDREKEDETDTEAPDEVDTEYPDEEEWEDDGYGGFGCFIDTYNYRPIKVCIGENLLDKHNIGYVDLKHSSTLYGVESSVTGIEGIITVSCAINEFNEKPSDGARTVITLEGNYGFEILPEIKINKDGEGRISLIFGGGCERYQMIEALRFLADSMEELCKKI